MLKRMVGMVVALMVWSASAFAAPEVRSVGFTVSDLDRSVAFFTEVLGFRELERDDVMGEGYERFAGVFGARMATAELTLGEEHVVLTQFLAPRGRPIPVDSKSNDSWFQHIAIVVSDMDAAYAHLRQAGVRHVSTGPQTIPAWNQAAGGIRAFYFQDADGHNLEVIWYPPGKGNPRWQDKSRLFLGIDHTAIAVSDTDGSLAFYRDLLGLEVAGGAENYGTEQEHLNGVFGSRVRITALKGSSGPGIEFLEYLAPSSGRPSPVDLAASDLAHWQVVVSGLGLEDTLARLRARQQRLVSPGVIDLPDAALGYPRGFLVRDPDGHALALVP